MNQLSMAEKRFPRSHPDIAAADENVSPDLDQAHPKVLRKDA
jgi:hypothetical protein